MSTRKESEHEALDPAIPLELKGNAPNLERLPMIIGRPVGKLGKAGVGSADRLTLPQ
jgi:hypothetical protein